MHVQFLGSGDAFGSGGRLNTCFLVSANATSFLIDCGATALIAMRRFGVDPNVVRTIFVSHLHGDHFGGLPFFILDAQFGSRRAAPLTIAGPPGLRRRLAETMEALFPGSTKVTRKFETHIIEMTPNQRAVIDGVAVTPYEVDHACGAPPFALRLECDGRTVAYTGDTAWTPALIAAGGGADLLIAEAYVYDRAVKHHLDYATLRQRLPEIGARRVILTHMGPDMLARRGTLAHESAEDGMIVAL